MRKTVAAAILALTMLGLAAVPASGAPIAVDCSSDPGALQPAIDAASPGRTLLISGTYVGDVSVPKNLTLKGETGATLKPSGDVLEMVTVSAGATVALKGLALHDFDRVG